MPRNVRAKSAGVLLLLGSLLAGCGGPGINPQADAQHWADRFKPGMSADEARNVMDENDFENWSAGRVIYAFRDKVARKDYSDGVVLTVSLDDSGRVAYAETYASPWSPYPMVWPTYP